MEIQRSFVEQVQNSLQRKTPLIEVIIGPRQVGKTTGIKQLLANIVGEHYYISADGDILKNSAWLLKHWTLAKSKSINCILIIDEIQKIENWAETIKELWDSQNLKSDHIKIILLGSSSLQLQKGLSESLAGRFTVHKVYHWSPQESAEAFQLNLNEFLKYGGYPGSYQFINNKIDWLEYVKHSIVDAVIGKDILSIARVKSPALFKQTFELACSYACQEVSYTKLLGQLQDKGNTELVKHYLELYEQAYLVKQLFKFSNKKVLSRSSSPKILPLCPALYSITLDADYNSDNFGRAFELTIGMLLNQLPGELYYWRMKNLEVDYVLKFGKKIWAIEVKTERKEKTKAMYVFKIEFPNAELIIINQENYIQELEKIKYDIYKGV